MQPLIQTNLTMRFSTGLLDYLFGEKLTVEIPTKDGRTIKRRVTRKWLQKMESEGAAQRVEDSVVRVRHLTTAGVKIENWIVGEHVTQEQVDHYLDPAEGEIHAMSFYDEGKLRTVLLPRDEWEQAKATLDSMW